jgi:hypothetical protein
MESKTASAVGAGVVSVITPLVFPQIPLEIGIVAYAGAAGLFLYAGRDWLRSRLPERWRRVPHDEQDRLHDPKAVQERNHLDRNVRVRGLSEHYAKLLEGRESKPSWVPLDQAIRYIVSKSQWGVDHDQKDPNFYVNLGIHIRDALACGDMTARGRKFHTLRGGIKDPPLHPLIPIPRDFWEDAFIDTWWPLHHGVSAQTIARRGGSTVKKGDHEGMHDIRLDQREVETLWPESDHSLFREAWAEASSGWIPFVRLRDFAPAWGVPLPRMGPGQNNAYHLEGALRQAAVRGKLRVEGRQYRGPVRHNDPLVPIPPEHFRDYGFGHGVLNYEEPNDASHTGDVRMMTLGQRGKEGVTFYDLHLLLDDARAVVTDFAKDPRIERP